MDFDYKETYSSQRKNRMGDALLDYINDDDITSNRVYDEILSEVDEMVEYHQKQLNKSRELKSLLMGNRPDSLAALAKATDTMLLNEDAWSDFPTQPGDYIKSLSDDILAL